MPTSVPGHPDVALQHGFSLLEVIVVLVIISVITGAVGLGLRAADGAGRLMDDAKRLALLFPAAQAEARKTGLPVVWEYNEGGYRFTQTPRALLLPAPLAERLAVPASRARFPPGNPLREREWASERPVDVRVHPAHATIFHDEWVSGPQQVELHDGLMTIRVLRGDNGLYQVQP